MDRQRWQQVEAILDDALELPRAELPVFLDRACAGDEALRDEVERLLEADRSEGLLDRATEAMPISLGELFGLEPSAPDADVEGRKVGPFKLVRRAGAGGMGVVYEALDTRLDRRVALKFLPPEYGRIGDAKARFLREARAASALDHPNICTVHDIGETTDGRLYIVMGYYEGETLKERLAAGPLPVEEARVVALQVARGLQHAHAAGITHRDIKPANVILTEDGTAKILDFGIAKVGGEAALTLSGSHLGTPAYMAPEQARGEKVDARTDLWAVGVLLYEMLAGRRAFRAGGAAAAIHAILNEEPEPIRKLRPEVPPALARVVEKLLAKQPEDRYQDAAALIADLAAGTAPESARRWRWAALAAVAALAVVVAALLVWRQRAAAPPLYVAVMPTEVPAPGAAAAGDGRGLLADAVEAAILLSLSGLRGIASVTADADELAGLSPSAAARALAATEVVASRLVCDETELCRATLQRLDGADGSVLWVKSHEVPADDLQLVVSAVAGHLREGYASYKPRRDAPRAQLSSAEWEEYLRLRRSFESKEGTNDAELMDRLAALRRRSPRFLEPYLLEAELALHAFHFSRDPSVLDRGFELLAEARELSPGEPRVLYQLFDLAAEAQRWDLAGSTLGELERADPASSAVLQRQATLEARRGDPARGLELMRRAARLRPDSPTLFSLARLEFRQGDVSAARQTLETLIERSPQHFRAISFLASIELVSGSLERAVDLYQKLIERSPDYTGLSNLGVAYLLLERFDDAATTFRLASAEEPGNPISALNLADALLLLGRSSEAQALYGEVLARLDAESAEADWQQFTMRAQALAHLGRHREAVSAIQRALQAAPSHPQVAFEAALVYAVIGERSSALANAERALELGLDRRWFTLPWFAELREQTAFAELLAGSRPPD